MDDRGRVLGIDFGDRRIGLALSDGLALTAQPLATLPNRRKHILADLAQVIRDQDVRAIVLGLPLHMNGSEGDKAGQVREFGARLAESMGLPVHYVDERLTTAAAGRILSQTEMSGSKKRAVVDRLAAALILQTWLDRQSRQAS